MVVDKTTNASFFGLPNELIDHVFRYLTTADLQSTTCVNRDLYELANNEAFVDRYLRAHAPGASPTPPAFPDPRARSVALWALGAFQHLGPAPRSYTCLAEANFFNGESFSGNRAWVNRIDCDASELRLTLPEDFGYQDAAPVRLAFPQSEDAYPHRAVLYSVKDQLVVLMQKGAIADVHLVKRADDQSNAKVVSHVLCESIKVSAHDYAPLRWDGRTHAVLRWKGSDMIPGGTTPPTLWHFQPTVFIPHGTAKQH